VKCARALGRKEEEALNLHSEGRAAIGDMCQGKKKNPVVSQRKARHVEGGERKGHRQGGEGIELAPHVH